MKNVYLIACTKAKQNYSCTTEEMYMKSSLYRLSYEYCINEVKGNCSEIYILSAKYHLLPLSKKISPYNETLINMNSNKKKEWGQVVYNQMKETFDMNNTHFVFLTGKEYMQPIISYLKNDQYSNPIPQQYSLGCKMKWLKDNTIKILIEAKQLRNTETLHKIPNNMPGWYKWWASEDTLKQLLDSPYISKNYYSELFPNLTKKNIDGINYYYIYVGVAIKESIRSRLDWHVNQKHTKSSVESGFLSTLRQTISSLVAKDQYDEENTNKLIDSLVIEYYPVDLPIKSIKAKEKIERIEKEELNNNMLPLNLRDNKNIIVKNFLKELSQVRKQSKLK